MLLASCLDASDDPDHLKEHVEKCLARGMPALADEFQIRAKTVWRGGMGSIAGMHVTVVSAYNDTPAPVPKRKTEDRVDHLHDHNHEHQHDHDHQHGHVHQSSGSRPEEENPENEKADDDGNPGPESDSRSHNHSHAHSVSDFHNHHSHDHSHSHNHSASSPGSIGPLRNLTEIRKLLEEADDAFLAPWVKTTAIATFTELAKAEAATHGADSIDAVHFHEVGAVDSIVDTVGTLVALHYLGAKTFTCSRIPIGEGTVWTDHGILPVPAPATLRLLVGMPTCPGPMGVVTGELVTPTGAALLRTLCLLGQEEFHEGAGNSRGTSKSPGLTGRPPSFTIRKIGIGAGTKDFRRHPNILRLLIGDDVVTR